MSSARETAKPFGPSCLYPDDAEIAQLVLGAKRARAWGGLAVILERSGLPKVDPMSRAGNQRNALDECQEQENAYVAASMAAQAAERAAGDGSLPARARGWAASVAAYVLDPITDWIGSLKR